MRGASFRGVFVGAVAVLVGLSTAQGQDYPTRPVQVITPAAAGNSPDVAMRIVADRLSQLWKQQVVVINRPGAGGLIAVQAAAALEKDGYSLYMTQASTYTVLPVEQEGKLPVNLQTAFAPIGMIGEQPIALAVNKDVPASDVARLVTLANSTPGGMLFGATNRGGQSHLTGELFRERAKANISFVHAAGAPVSLNDVIAGRIPIMFEGLAGLAPGLQGGAMKLLAVAAPKRLLNLPDLPTIDETVPGVVSSGWMVLMAPAGTPEAIVDTLSKQLVAAVADEKIRMRFAELGAIPVSRGSAEFAKFIAAETAKWGKVIRDAGIKPD